MSASCLGPGGLRSQGAFPWPASSDPRVSCCACLCLCLLLTCVEWLWEIPVAQEVKGNALLAFSLAGSTLTTELF